MSQPVGAAGTLHALLIGIDHYRPGGLVDGTYPSLGGCVRDVEQVEAFLKSKLGLTNDRILKLTSRAGPTSAPAEPPDRLPDYANMVGAFREVSRRACRGDEVYIHYSGHGARTPAIVPELRGTSPFDAALVPWDINEPSGRYLLDLELAMLLTEMVDRGLLVTLVLDAGQAAGATRSDVHASTRGVGFVDTTSRPRESLVAPTAELVRRWKKLTSHSRSGTGRGQSGGWLPDPQGYVLLSACRAFEQAYEFAFDGKEKNGALTYWLLDSLRDIAPNLTYRNMFNRVLAKVSSQFESQTPQLEGEADWVVFGARQAKSQFATTVVVVDRPGRRVMLGAGQAAGIVPGTRFAIYRRSAAGQVESNQRVGLVSVTQIGATDAWADVVETPASGQWPESGDQAVLAGAGTVKLVRKLLLAPPVAGQPLSTDQEAAFATVRSALQNNGWVEEAAPGEPADFVLTFREDTTEYVIADGAGVPIANIRPPLAGPQAAPQVVARLVHLAKYRAVQELDNTDQGSPLNGKLIVELRGVQDYYEPSERPEPRPFASPGNVPVIRPGQTTFLSIRNDSATVLNVSVFDLAPNWEIAQAYPRNRYLSYEPLDRGAELLIPLTASLPPGIDRGSDIVKVLATRTPANFHVLELPPLDRSDVAAPVRVRAMGHGVGPLDDLLQQVAADRPPSRSLVAATSPIEEWVAAQVEVRVDARAGQGHGPDSELAAVPELGRYKEFRLELSEVVRGETYRVRALTPFGEMLEGRFRLPVGRAELERVLAYIPRAGSSQGERAMARAGFDAIKEIGGRLFEALLDGRINAEFQEAIGRAQARGEVLRLRLVTDDPWLLSVPWEYLFDPVRKDFVSLSVCSPPVRQRARFHVTPPPEPLTAPLRVLFVGAQLQDEFDIDAEVEALRALEREQSGLFKLVDVVRDPIAREFLDAVRTRDYHVLHFSGTGVPTLRSSEDGAIDQSLVLMRNDRKKQSPAESYAPEQLVSADALREALVDRPEVRIVLLNACHTSFLAGQLSPPVPAAVGMGEYMTARACIRFATGLYRCLLLGEFLETAVTVGRQEIDRADPGGREWGLPVLFLQASDGVVLAPPQDRSRPFVRTTAKRPPPRSAAPDDRASQREVLALQLKMYEVNLQSVLAKSPGGERMPAFLKRQHDKIQSAIDQVKSELKALGE